VAAFLSLKTDRNSRETKGKRIVGGGSLGHTYRINQPVRQTHQPNQQHIQTQTHHNHRDVELKQPPILYQATTQQLPLHQHDEINIQPAIQQEEDPLLNAIPNIVQLDPERIDLQPRGDPDAEDADVDAEHDEEGDPFQPELFALGMDEQGDAVADDLDQALHFQAPADHEDEVVVEGGLDLADEVHPAEHTEDEAK
jgi:hypothetical protein